MNDHIFFLDAYCARTPFFFKGSFGLWSKSMKSMPETQHTIWAFLDLKLNRCLLLHPFFLLRRFFWAKFFHHLANMYLSVCKSICYWHQLIFFWKLLKRIQDSRVERAFEQKVNVNKRFCEAHFKKTQKNTFTNKSQ